MNTDEIKLNLELACDRLAKKDYALAEALFNEIIEQRHAGTNQQLFASALRGLTEIEATRGNESKAHAYLAIALQIDQDNHFIPGIIEDYELLGRIYLAVQDFERTIQALESAVKFEPQAEQIHFFTRAYTNLAFIFRERGDLRGATRVTLKALQLVRAFKRPDLAAGHYSMLAAISLSRGHLQRARILLRVRKGDR